MIRVVAVIFGLYSVYVATVVVAQPHILRVAICAASLSAAIGLWFRKPWSQYCVYFVSLVVAGQWLWAASNYYYRTGWPVEQTAGHVFALIPGVSIVILAVASSLLAFRTFRARS